MLCIYHIADHDGKGSAAIVRSKFPAAEFFGYDYGMNIPEDLIAEHEEIILCDISFPMDYMFELNKTKDFTWIDHHISAIRGYEETLKNRGETPIKGLRRDGTAAIILTWEYFCPKKEIPLAIKYIGLNDVFDLRDKNVRPFEFAVQSLGANNPDDKVWKQMINNKMNIEEMVEKGKTILSWIKARNYRLVRTISFESQYMGYKCICANMPRGGSDFYDSLDNIDDYDVRINFFMNSDHNWSISFYTEKDNVDVSKIAASFGGGGHMKAAGASGLRKLPEFLKKGFK